MMRTLVLALAAGTLLLGCAGSPVAVKSAPGAQDVTIDGTPMVVSKSGDTWSVTFRDTFIHNLVVTGEDHFRRRIQFKRAIEQVSGCRVADSFVDPGSLVMQATVACSR